PSVVSNRQLAPPGSAARVRKRYLLDRGRSRRCGHRQFDQRLAHEEQTLAVGENTDPSPQTCVTTAISKTRGLERIERIGLLQLLLGLLISKDRGEHDDLVWKFEKITESRRACSPRLLGASGRPRTRSA